MRTTLLPVLLMGTFYLGSGASGQDSRESLALPEALAIATANHPDLLAAQEQVRAAEGRRAQAGLFPNPELYTRMESGRFSGPATGDAEYITGVSQPIPLSRRLRVAEAVGERELDKRNFRVEAKRLEVETAVRKAFASAVYHAEVRATWEETVENARTALEVARARLDAGEAIPSEVAQVRIELQRFQLARDRSLHEFEEAIEALSTAMGTPDTSISSLSYTPMNESPSVPALDDLLERVSDHPAVAVAEADAQVWEERETLAREERKPDVRVEAAYRRIGAEEANSFDVGLSLPLPLFDRNQGQIREAHAEAAAARKRAEGVRNGLSLRVRIAHGRLEQAINATAVLRNEILPGSERVLETVETRYRAGDVSLSDVLPVRRDTTQLRLEYLRAVRDVMLAWADLVPIVELPID